MGCVISVVFILGAIENAREGNYLMASLLAAVAAAFVLIPPYVLRRSIISTNTDPEGPPQDGDTQEGT